MKKWFLWTVISIPVGLILGYGLGLLWFLAGVIVLGYGDSSPTWVNTVTNGLLYGGLIAGILGGQFLFFFRGRLEPFARGVMKKKEEEGRGVH